MPSSSFVAGILLSCVVGAASVKQPSAPGSEALPGTYGFLSKSNNDVGNAASSILGIQVGLDEMNSALHEEYKRWSFRQKNLTSVHDYVQAEIIDLQNTLEKQKQLKVELQRDEDTYLMYRTENDKVAAAVKQVSVQRDQQKAQMESEIKALECQLAEVPEQRRQKLTAEYNLVSKLGDDKALLQQNILGFNKEVLDENATAATFAMNSKQEISNLLKDIQALQSRINDLEMEVMAQAQGQMEVQRVQHQVEAQIAETVKQRQKVMASMDECKTKKAQQDLAIKASKQSFILANQRFQECQQLDATNQALQGELTQCISHQRA